MRDSLETRARLRVLVTGGTGLVGTALVSELREAGYGKVIPLGRADGDLAQMAAAEAVISAARPDIVYHLAARVNGIMGNFRTQGENFLENVRINTNVVEAARRAGVTKLVAMGSTAIYSDQVPRPMREDDLWLGAPHGVRSRIRPRQARHARATGGISGSVRNGFRLLYRHQHVRTA